MAGEALAERNRAARERIANDPKLSAAKLAKVDRDKYDLSGHSNRDIILAFQGDGFGDDDFSRLTGNKASGPKTDNSNSGNNPGGGAEDTSADTPIYREDKPFFAEKKDPFGVMPGVPVPGGIVDSTQTQNVRQDNDINQTIGDDNTLTNEVDNSVRQYGDAGSYLKSFMKEYDFFR